MWQQIISADFKYSPVRIDTRPDVLDVPRLQFHSGTERVNWMMLSHLSTSRRSHLPCPVFICMHVCIFVLCTYCHHRSSSHDIPSQPLFRSKTTLYVLCFCHLRVSQAGGSNSRPSGCVFPKAVVFARTWCTIPSRGWKNTEIHTEQPCNVSLII